MHEQFISLSKAQLDVLREVANIIVGNIFLIPEPDNLESIFKALGVIG